MNLRPETYKIPALPLSYKGIMETVLWRYQLPTELVVYKQELTRRIKSPFHFFKVEYLTMESNQDLLYKPLR